MAGIFCTSCGDDTELSDVSFVGDSLVARWDLQASFPSSVVENYGVSGSGILYIESLSGRFKDRTVVVISGTNDVGALTGNPDVDTSRYAERYLAAIEAMGANRIYLYCIFPRGKEAGGKLLNPLIISLNEKIHSLVEENHPSIQYIDVYDNLLYDGLLNPAYTMDGLHLNVYGYEVIAAALKDAI